MSTKNRDEQKTIAELTAKRKKRQAIRAAAEAAAVKTAAPKVAAKAPVKSVKPAKVKADLAEDGVKAADIMEDLGEEMAPGVYVPEELADQSVDADEADEDPAYAPGLLIPPDLEDIVSAVTDPATFSVTEDTQFTLYPHVPSATTVADILTAGAHWILCANGRPLAEINLKDQDHADKIAAHFVTADFARSIVAGIQSHGLVEALKVVHARPYAAVIDKNKRLEQERSKLQATMEETLRQKAAALTAKYNSMVGLALAAAANNVAGVENPLKDAFISAATSAGLADYVAAEMVDNVFFTHGPKTFGIILDKAYEWANKTDGEREVIKGFVETTARRPLSASVRSAHSYAAGNPNYNHYLAQQMQANAAPISGPAPAQAVEFAPAEVVRATATYAGEALSDKAAFRKKFGTAI